MDCRRLNWSEDKEVETKSREERGEAREQREEGCTLADRSRFKTNLCAADYQTDQTICEWVANFTPAWPTFCTRHYDNKSKELFCCLSRRSLHSPSVTMCHVITTWAFYPTWGPNSLVRWYFSHIPDCSSAESSESEVIPIRECCQVQSSQYRTFISFREPNLLIPIACYVFREISDRKEAGERVRHRQE